MVLVNLYSVEGLVVALKANYLIVELVSGQNFNCPLHIRIDETSSFRFLCKRRNRLDYYSDFVNVGDRVFHEKFGYGIITELEADKALVDFEKADSRNIKTAFLTSEKDL